jgi:hypothetical protein
MLFRLNGLKDRTITGHFPGNRIKNQGNAFFLSFGFDDADGLAVYKQYIIRRTDIGLVFPYGYPRRGFQVDFIFVLKCTLMAWH